MKNTKEKFQSQDTKVKSTRRNTATRRSLKPWTTPLNKLSNSLILLYTAANAKTKKEEEREKKKLDEILREKGRKKKKRIFKEHRVSVTSEAKTMEERARREKGLDGLKRASSATLTRERRSN